MPQSLMMFVLLDMLQAASAKAAAQAPSALQCRACTPPALKTASHSCSSGSSSSSNALSNQTAHAQGSPHAAFVNSHPRVKSLGAVGMAAAAAASHKMALATAAVTTSHRP